MRLALDAGVHSSLRTTTERLNDPFKVDLSNISAMVWTLGTSDQEASSWLQTAQAEGRWLVEVHHLVTDDTDYFWATKRGALAAHLQHLSESDVWLASQGQVASYIASKRNIRFREEPGKGPGAINFFVGGRRSTSVSLTTKVPEGWRIVLVEHDSGTELVTAVDGRVRWAIPGQSGRARLKKC